MRTILMIAGLASLGAGTFCVANSGTAFMSVAFVVGLVMCIMGACEVLIETRTNAQGKQKEGGLLADGIVLFIVGAVMAGGFVADDYQANILFAVLALSEGVRVMTGAPWTLSENSRSENIDLALGVLQGILGVYMFVNPALLDLPVVGPVGAFCILVGLKRFRDSLDIQYVSPTFLTGSVEKLREAEYEEKMAMAKAKEGIRESKLARQRIDKIKKDLAEEERVLTETTLRKQGLEDEKISK